MDRCEDVVLTTRIRLARNVKGYKFTNNMLDREKQELLDKIKNNLKEKYTILELNNIDEVTKKSLVEKHIISKELLLSNNTALLMSEDNNLVTMINEEDHFRIQSFKSGLDIESAYNNIIQMDKNISEKIEYAYSNDYGYITACPTCIGTGMRVSVMLSLPALEKIGALDKVFYEISNLGISIRGMYGENTKGEGSIYQISNQKTLGIKEEDIIKGAVEYFVTDKVYIRNIYADNTKFLKDIIDSLLKFKQSISLSCMFIDKELLTVIKEYKGILEYTYFIWKEEK